MGRDLRADLPVAALEILVYRIQAALLGGLRKAMVRVLCQHKVQELRFSDTRPFETRIPTTGGTDFRAGALARDRTASSKDGWSGGEASPGMQPYRSLSQIESDGCVGVKQIDAAVASFIGGQHFNFVPADWHIRGFMTRAFGTFAASALRRTLPLQTPT
jgi:hypothetical protein